MELTPPLPFPVVPSTSPVTRAQVSDDAIVYYVTVPMSVLMPAAVRLSDGNGTMRYMSILRILEMFVFLFSTSMRRDSGDEDSGQFMPDGTTPRFMMYFEYLAPPNASIPDPETYQSPLLSCVGVRFAFVVNDDTCEFSKALQRAIDSNAAGKGGGNGGGNPGKGRRKGGGGPPPRPALYEAWRDVTSVQRWMEDCMAYVDWFPETDYDFARDVGEEGPTAQHRFHASNVFSFDASCEVAGAHALQRGYAEDRPVFGLPCMAFWVPRALHTTMAILAVTLPGTFRWYAQPRAARDETMRVLRSHDRLVLYFDGAYVKRNDLRDLRDLVRARTAAANGDAAREEVRREAVRALQDIWRDTAYVSEPIKLLSRWAEARETWTTDAPMVMDTTLSYFGNMMATELYRLEVDCQFVSTHATFLRLLINSMNAYWYALKLHCNVLMLGGGATGKSHMLDELRDLLVPGTVTKVSHQTDKAATVDSDNNDHISEYHETPPGFLGQGGAGAHRDQTGNHIIKDMMTSCEVTTHSIFADSESGRRYSTRCSSECSGVLLMATNEREDIIPEAMGTRTIKMTVNATAREGKSVQSVSAARDLEETGGAGNRAAFADLWRSRQAMVNMVEKMIFIGCVPDVSMTVADVVMDRMLGRMRDRGIVTAEGESVRGIKFLRSFMRTLTIVHAVDKYANDPASPGHGRAFTFANLEGIGPYLVCSEEMALFSMTLCHDQLVQVNQFRVAELVATLLLPSLERDEEGAPASQDGLYAGFPTTRRSGNGGQPQQQQLTRAQLYRMIETEQRRGGYVTKLSSENIKVAFNQLVKNHFNGAPLVVDNTDSGGLLGINADYLDRHFVLEGRRFRCAFDAHSILADVFRDGYAHKHLTPGERTFVLGTVFDTNMPFLFDTLKVAPVDDRVIAVHLMEFNVLAGGGDIAYFPVTENLEDMVSARRPGGVAPAAPALYAHRIAGAPVGDVYPDTIARAYARAHGVGLENKRKLELDAEIGEFSTKHSRIS